VGLGAATSTKERPPGATKATGCGARPAAALLCRQVLLSLTAYGAARLAVRLVARHQLGPAAEAPERQLAASALLFGDEGVPPPARLLEHQPERELAPWQLAEGAGTGQALWLVLPAVVAVSCQAYVCCSHAGPVTTVASAAVGCTAAAYEEWRGARKQGVPCREAAAWAAGGLAALAVTAVAVAVALAWKGSKCGLAFCR
jgi:hypothetical protein